MTRRIVSVLIALMFLLVGGAGCAPEVETEVVSNWPEATDERPEEKPAEPIVWPLTGLEAPSADAIAQRIVSVKIENSREARPQSNLQLADVVYETVTEGGITRFNAMFHSEAPTVVGPVRSARLSDTDIVPQYDALFCFSGASQSVNAKVRASGVDNLSEDVGVTKPFTRSSERPRPHNLYASIPELRAEAERRGMATTAQVAAFAFEKPSSAATGTPVASVDIPFSSYNKVTWTYDSAANSYLRANNGTPFTDDATGKQVSARNVVVLWAQYIPASQDKVGSTTYDIQLTGSGRATVFRDGQAFNGTWEAGADAPPVFKAEDGTQIKLRAGNTWFQVVNTSVNIAMK
ncbi:MAG: DUF3048 domain-containing protein [Coriobacteriia bacterium]|nr:DUF3048 domain-containing protein [Coriobacteriia bacterium]MBN2839549.1 DUF3048 domain-containing protein [Coriobacteriia bacterium]